MPEEVFLRKRRSAPGMLDPVPEPAEECRRLDVPDGEAVTEPDCRFLALHLKGDFVYHVPLGFACEPKKVGGGTAGLSTGPECSRP